jgi:NAD(P)H dehydrogenase (quinone)
MTPLILLAFVLPVAAGSAPPAPVRILIAYHSETGNTEAFAKAVRQGAASVGGVEVVIRKTADAGAEEVVRADGILLGAPVYWSSLSAEAKRFLDRSGDALFKARPEAGEGRTAGVFCTGGAVASGKDMARLTAVAAFLNMRFFVLGGVDAEGYGTLGAQATTGPPDPGLSEKELEEARRFGERFARLTRHVRSTAR